MSRGARDAARRRAHILNVPRPFGRSSRGPPHGIPRPAIFGRRHWLFLLRRTRQGGTPSGFYAAPRIRDPWSQSQPRAAVLASACASGLGAAPHCSGRLASRSCPAQQPMASTSDSARFVTPRFAERRLNPAERTVRTAPSTLLSGSGITTFALLAQIASGVCAIIPVVSQTSETASTCMGAMPEKFGVRVRTDDD